MRNHLVLCLVAAALAAACGSTTTDPDPTGSGGSAASSTSESSATGTSCVPGSTMSCTCHAINPPGIATCLPDGSAYGACMGEDGSDCACPLGRGDGCCAGDGICCACVQGCDPGTDMQQDAETDALIACVCAAGVCADECEVECAGGGITADCAPCVQQARTDACKAEYEACGGS
ncbi:hypothetical protein WMF20_05070 [Sorangium sp. So ce834]|uniref:hypothetical protein n=1 Tax=Sorangium sp. So ce834 TaxID=3133321 RepID=UPI003F629FEC